MDYYTAGIKMEWNLFSWGADKHAIEKQELELTRTDLRSAQLHSRIRTAVASIENDVTLKRRTMALLDAQIVMERQKQLLVETRHREGLATSSELVDAESALTTALIRLEQTRIELSLIATDLAATIGISE
jgi:outer membrane protein TolC